MSLMDNNVMYNSDEIYNDSNKCCSLGTVIHTYSFKFIVPIQ
jgi:hypothetical protein